MLAVVAVLLCLGGSAAYAWTQKQYYVAPDGGTVAIYQGVQAEVPVLDLHRVYQPSQVEVTDLPDFTQRQVRDGISARNLEDARNIMARLTDLRRLRQRRPATADAAPAARPAPTPTRPSPVHAAPSAARPAPARPPPAVRLAVRLAATPERHADDRLDRAATRDSR